MFREIDEEKRNTARAMLKAGKWVHEVARALDLSRATVYRIKHEDSGEDVSALADRIRQDIADRYLVMADTILKGIDEIALERASLKERAIAAAIFTDKAAKLGAFKDTRSGPVDGGQSHGQN